VWNELSVAVVVPAHQEERLIGRTLRGLPALVDHIVVVDDASTDGTSQAVRAVADPRVVLLRHPENLGVGAALATGYQEALTLGADVLVVMAGDNQMDPADLPRLLDPIGTGRADYVKGNRFVHPEARNMPWERRLAGRWLARLTRAASGLRIDDSQCGYTALRADMARRVPLARLWPRYGYPNDLLLLLANVGARVEEVPVRPVYASERSGVRPWHAVVVARVIATRWLELRVSRLQRVVVQ
jgi:glycosyltransferase involved in cell wall biosynthesis